MTERADDPVRVPMDWANLLHHQRKAVCRYLQDEALDMLATDGEDHELAKWMEAAAHRLGAEADRRRKAEMKRAAKGPVVLHRRPGNGG